jgi:hypothetical protein
MIEMTTIQMSIQWWLFQNALWIESRWHRNLRAEWPELIEILNDSDRFRRKSAGRLKTLFPIIIPFIPPLSGFHLINVLPKGFKFKFNASFYVTQILGPLSDWSRTQVGRTNRKLWVHADNTRPHTATVTLQFMQQNSMKRVAHAHTHTIWHLLISISSVTSSNFC